jgi:hypothetical protein
MQDQRGKLASSGASNDDTVYSTLGEVRSLVLLWAMTEYFIVIIAYSYLDSSIIWYYAMKTVQCVHITYSVPTMTDLNTLINFLSYILKH